jgi:hypothetical protein
MHGAKPGNRRRSAITIQVLAVLRWRGSDSKHEASESHFMSSGAAAKRSLAVMVRFLVSGFNTMTSEQPPA